MIRRIGVLTSGGDAPGMNAAIRAATRTALFNGLNVVGIRRGYEGLIEGDFVPMTRSSVGGIILHGGTVLRTARSKAFMKPEGVNAAITMLKSYDIDAVVIIGGDGSFRGAQALYEKGFTVVGVPCTIDNDMGGTDCTIGFDTACNTALDCIGKLRDTASSHDRMFIVEVMGRKAGYLALETGVACGAEAVLVPEVPVSVEALVKKIRYSKERGKTHSLIVIAEGVMPASELATKLHAISDDYDPRIVVLGHVQRGGAPSCFDTILASRLGAAAVETLLEGKNGMMVGRVRGEIISSKLEAAWKERIPIDVDMLRLVDELSI
jgi:6-phosphofructokinase 1